MSELNQLLNTEIRSPLNYSLVEVPTTTTVAPPVTFKRGYGGFINALETPSRDARAVQEAAGHDFTAVKLPVFNSKGVKIPNKYSCTNKATDQPLGESIVGKDYRIVQPNDLYSIADDLIREDDSVVITDVIQRDNGNFMGLQLNLGNYSPTHDDDVIENNVTLYTTFDGSKATGLKTSNTRIWCKNTFAAAKTAFTIRHTSQSDVRFAEMRILLGLAAKNLQNVANNIEALTGKHMTDNQSVKWFEELLLKGRTKKSLKSRAVSRVDNQVSLFEHLLRKGAGAESGAGTAYGAFNALTNFTTHERSTRVCEGESAESTKWESNLFGSSAVLAQTGFEQLLAR